MATRRGPRFKECRRLGVNVCGNPKAMKRLEEASKGRGKVRPKKMSEFGKQLLEKQKVKAYYGLLEKQLLNYFKAASRSKEKTADAFFKTLECRLDNVVYRIGFGNSIRLSRQLVNHGHILVNGNRVDIPSYIVSEGDVITLRERSRSNEIIKDNMANGGFALPYIERDAESLSGKLIRVPEREEIPVEIIDQLVVEHYSR